MGGRGGKTEGVGVVRTGAQTMTRLTDTRCEEPGWREAPGMDVGGDRAQPAGQAWTWHRGPRASGAKLPRESGCGVERQVAPPGAPKEFPGLPPSELGETHAPPNPALLP